MELERVELAGALLPLDPEEHAPARVHLANVEAPYSEWRVVELHGCRLTGLDLRDSSGRDCCSPTAARI